jgi:type I restriction enzyme S subunit
MNNYSSYKDTNTPWIGDIPTGWSLKSLKHIFIEKKSTKNSDLGCGSISFGRVIYKDDEKIPESTKESYQEVLNGEFLINPLNLNYDLKSLRIGLSRINVVVSQGYIVLNIKDGFVPEYYEYLLRKFDVEHMKSLGQGVRQTISYTHIKDEKLVVPPLKEQIQISRYLDKKTSQLDSLMNKIEKRIELLKEQRTSLINRCVTKGLDLNVETKDSDVKWLGKIPKGWKVTRLKYISTKGVQYGLNIEADSYVENGVRFLRITDINSDGTLKEEDGVYLNDSDVSDEYYLKYGDILFSRSGGTVGKSTLITKCDEPMSFAGYLVRFSFDDLSLATYVKWVTESGVYWRWIDLQITQSTIQNVNGEKYSNFIFALPSKVEIEKINSYLLEKTKAINQVIKLHEKKIKYLTDYRQSLISSAVTGKIKVMECAV